MATSILAGLNEEATQQEMLGGILVLLSSMLEKMPRVDGADRLLVSHSESSPAVTIAAAQTLATLTTLGNQTNIGGRDASHMAYAAANAGSMHIYNNLIFGA